MKVSELEAFLKGFKETYGDLDIYINIGGETTYYPVNFAMVQEVQFDFGATETDCLVFFEKGMGGG